jgi:hypothetical protein
LNNAWTQAKQNCSWCGAELANGDKVNSQLNETKAFNPTRKDWMFHKECVAAYEDRENNTTTVGPVVTDQPVATHKIDLSYFFGGGLK